MTQRKLQPSAARTVTRGMRFGEKKRSCLMRRYSRTYTGNSARTPPRNSLLMPESTSTSAKISQIIKIAFLIDVNAIKQAVVVQPKKKSFKSG